MAASAQKLKATTAAEQVMDTVAARLAAVAARQNPGVPMVECLKLATEAVRVHADAYPLAYESWGGTHDGPVSNRVKNFTPGQLPKALPESASGPAADPGANGGSGTFDEVKKRLDGLEEGLGSAASLDPTVAGFYQRLKDWWHGGEEAQHTPAAPTHAPAPAPAQRAPYMTPSNNAASDHVDDAVTRHHDEQGRREFNDIMNRLNGDQAEMNHKWDTPREDRFESPAETNQRTRYLQDAHDRRTTDMEDEWTASAIR